MFTILGGDGKEYGPANAEEIRRWIAGGRANLETKAKAAGTEAWRRLGDFTEFGTPADAPPVIAASPPVGNAFTAAPASPATAALTLADRGQRFLARLVDWVLEIICALPGGIILGTEALKIIIAMSQGKEPDFSELDASRLLLGASIFVFATLSLLVVQVWMLSTRGQSIGKRVVGIRVVRQDGNAGGIVHAWVLRELVITGIGIILGFIPFLGLLLRPAFHLTDWCMIFRDDQRCLHDLIAGTKVVKV